jgi:hypothetical protein
LEEAFENGQFVDLDTLIAEEQEVLSSTLAFTLCAANLKQRQLV